MMASHLFGAKPLSEPILDYFELDYEKHIPMKFGLAWKSEVSFKKMHL